MKTPTYLLFFLQSCRHSAQGTHFFFEKFRRDEGYPLLIFAEDNKTLTSFYLKVLSGGFGDHQLTPFVHGHRTPDILALRCRRDHTAAIQSFRFLPDHPG